MTLRYASPEQIRGDTVTTATDIYSLGVLLYELLSGRSPYPRGLRGRDLERHILEIEPAPPGGRDRSSGRELDHIVAMALRKEPDRRYPSVEALAEDVERYLARRPVRAVPPSARYRAGRWLRRHRLAAAAAAVTLTALSVAGGWYAWARADHARRLAAEQHRTEQTLELLVDMFRQSDPYEAPGESARPPLATAAAKVEALHDRPLLQATLRDTLGQVYLGLGRTADAAEQIETAWRLREDLLSPDHPERIAGRRSLADLRSRQGRLDEADTLYRQALLSLRRNRDHPLEIARTLDRLAAVRIRQGLPEEAGRLARQALRLYEEALGPRHPELAQALQTLAARSRRMGRSAEAEALYRRALALQQELLGDAHPRTALSRHHLARTLLDQGRLDAALRHQEAALDVQRRVLALSHPDLNNSYHVLDLIRRRGRVPCGLPYAPCLGATLGASPVSTG